MLKILKNVVAWPKRFGPNGVIPNHLKLAILSRGQIDLPAKTVKWFLEVLKSRGEELPHRLMVNLSELTQTFTTTFELFINQRSSLTVTEIDESLAEYLTLRRKQVQSDCFLMPTWLPAKNRLDLETSIEVEISRLFVLAKVQTSPRDELLRYILLSYVCLPRSIFRFTSGSQVTGTPSPPPSSAMPILDGYTKPSSQFHLRKEPNELSESLGVQAGTSVRVQLIDKYFRKIVWHKIRLLEPMRLLPKPDESHSKSFECPAGTEAWISSNGLDFVIAPWTLFRNDVIAFEQEQANQSLDQCITSLRQRLHPRNLPFDYVIGTKQGSVYQEDIQYVSGKWQISKDYDSVRAPDNRIVDIQHLMVALDVLPRKQEPVWYFGTPIGTNWAASTWSGDVGSAVADATLGTDSVWESWNASITEAERVEHYFLTRVSDRDLLGDIDGWGISQLRGSRAHLNTLGDLFALYFENITPGGARTLTTSRADALEAFARHYGFTYSPDRDRYPALVKQERVVSSMRHNEIDIFAQAWMYKHHTNIPPNPRFSSELTNLFLYWLECALIENGVTVD